MRLQRPRAEVDFETEGIEQRPEYPPKPVGVAIREKGRAEYLAWDHPTENNCTKEQARKRLLSLHKNNACIYHNAAFDIAVSTERLDLPMPVEYHDTLFLAFLHDPRDKSLSLKPLAEKYLDMPPDEQTLLKEWILANVPEAQPETKKNPWGKWICKAPGELVGRYAKGDVIRTGKLFNYLFKYVCDHGMYDAYIRELRCLPIFESMSKRGVAVPARRLAKDLSQWEAELEQIATKIRRRLKTKDLDIASSKQLAAALDGAGKIDEWEYTAPSKTYPEGQKSTKRENLMKGCNDKKLIHDLSRHGILETYITTFGRPWLESARKYGRIYPSFNQVRSTEEFGGKATRGTRTGRPSSERPNLLNVPKNPEDPDKPWTIGLPNMRDYMVPEKGNVYIGRDYSQQELRILAHFEDGLLMMAYLDDPHMDVHEFVRQKVREIKGVLYRRKDIKITGFGIIYGMGVPGLMIKLECDADTAREVKQAVMTALPGIKNINDEIKKLDRKGEPIVTWGGRRYLTEEPKMINGKLRNFAYKQLNYLIQGSAADCTKESMARYSDVKHEDAHIVLNVYDELLVECPKALKKQEMIKLRDAMESIEFDVPMLSEGKMSAYSWGRMKDWEPDRRK